MSSASRVSVQVRLGRGQLFEASENHNTRLPAEEEELEFVRVVGAAANGAEDLHARVRPCTGGDGKESGACSSTQALFRFQKGGDTKVTECEALAAARSTAGLPVDTSIAVSQAAGAAWSTLSRCCDPPAARAASAFAMSSQTARSTSIGTP